MSSEFVSKKTRNEFREFLVGWNLREIEMEFEAAYIGCDSQHVPQVSGQRRSFVEQHYHSLDFTSPADTHRLLAAYESILNTATRKVPSQNDKAAAERAIDGLVACLKRDGFKYLDGRITPTTPDAKRVLDQASSGHDISEVTRRNIFDAIGLSGVTWSGRLSEIDFLSRLYDLEGLPSENPRFENVNDDIWQHRVNNPGDWSDDWIFRDARFDLLHASDEVFLRFLCEMVDPVVRPADTDVQTLVETFNQHLCADEWEIIPQAQISGKPVFSARRRSARGTNSLLLKGIMRTAQVFGANYMEDQISRMEAAVESDPALAIGTAKELVETCCKTILAERGKPVTGKEDIPTLTKAVLKELKLVPEGIPEAAKGSEVIKRLLSNLGTIGNGLAELRGLYGTGHGRHGKASGLMPRHAKLAVGAVVTLVTFLFDTHRETQQ